MIKKNYKGVHFIHKGTQNIDKRYKGTDLIFEQGYIREQTGVPPITTTYQTIGKNLIDYKIYGDTVQNGTPSSQTLVELVGLGDISKNKFDKNSMVYNGYIVSNTGLIAYTSASRIIYAPCKPNTTYTVSKVLSERFIVFYTTEKPDVGVAVYGRVNGHNLTSMTITAGNNAKYICAYVWTESADTLSPETIINSVQVEEGSTATSYEPFRYVIPININNNITNIYINRPLNKLQTNVDYIDFKNQKLYKQCYEYIFTGDETWITTGASSNIYYRILLSSSEIIGTASSSTQKCNYFKFGQPTSTNETTGISVYTSNGSTYVRFRDSSLTTPELINEFTKARYEEGFPVKLIFTINYTIEEAIQLPNIPTIKGLTTTFTFNTELQPSNMYIKYKSK